MTTRGILGLAAFTMALALPAAAPAVPILGPTGHSYEIVLTNMTWNDARAAALNMTHDGDDGYLATITSQVENDFVAGLLNGVSAWIGGTDAFDPDTWSWIDGPDAGDEFWQGLADGSPLNGAYTNWGEHDPNDGGGAGQDSLVICTAGVGPCVLENTGEWVDRPGSDLRAFVVEFGTAAQIPEPTTAILMGGGLVGLALASRRRRARSA